MKILFVENHARFARIAIASFLHEHEVEVQPSVAAALQSLQIQQFDAVLIDYDLDDGKGDVVVAALARMQPRPRIVAVSAHDEGNAALVAAGADVVCAKLQFAAIASVLIAK